jgi:hypothetical protein
MRSRILALGVVFLGCGGGRSGPDPADPDDVAVRPPPPDACAETAAILDDTPRLAAELQLDDAQRRSASAEYVALLTEACRSHGWPTAVIDCVRNAAGASELASCLGQLPGAAKKAHATLVADFRAEVEAKLAASRPPAPACAAVAENPAAWLARVPDGELGALATTLLVRSVDALCIAGAWSEADRACFGAARSAAEIERCGEALGADARAALAKARAALDARLDALAALVAAPSRIACDDVADHYYADAAWRTWSKRIRTRARTKALAAAAKAMTAACEAERWPPLVRACFASTVEPVDGEGCANGARWGTAPGESLTTTGVRACDAYVAELARQKRACKIDPAQLAIELGRARTFLVAQPEDAAADLCKQFSSHLETDPVPCAPPEPE